MTSDFIRGTIYSGVGGFALGVGLTTAFLVGATFKTAGPSLMVFPLGGLMFAVPAVIGRVADEAFKQMGWLNHSHTRLVAAHALTATVLAGVAAIMIGPPLDFCVVIGVGLALSALVVNLAVKDLL